jgi:hypothetical protein
MEGSSCRYDGFGRHPQRHFRVAIAFRPSRFDAFATLSGLADSIAHTDVETDSMRIWFTR